jgi:hypothetical protein
MINKEIESSGRTDQPHSFLFKNKESRPKKEI